MTDRLIPADHCRAGALPLSQQREALANGGGSAETE